MSKQVGRRPYEEDEDNFLHFERAIDEVLKEDKPMVTCTHADAVWMIRHLEARIVKERDPTNLQKLQRLLESTKQLQDESVPVTQKFQSMSLSAPRCGEPIFELRPNGVLYGERTQARAAAAFLNCEHAYADKKLRVVAGSLAIGKGVVRFYMYGGVGKNTYEDFFGNIVARDVIQLRPKQYPSCDIWLEDEDGKVYSAYSPPTEDEVRMHGRGRIPKPQIAPHTLIEGIDKKTLQLRGLVFIPAPPGIQDALQDAILKFPNTMKYIGMGQMMLGNHG